MRQGAAMGLSRGFWAWLRLALAGLALGSLAGCAETLDTSVTRFKTELPAPAGQSFAIVPEDPKLVGSIEFGQYSRLVAAQLIKQGYTEVYGPEAATLVVRFDYGVDNGREKLEADPFWGPWHGYRGYGWGGGWRGPRGAWGWGWQDPWFDGGIEAYTVYTSGIAVKIDDKASGKRLFEGRAEAVSTSNKLSYLVPNLVEALFTGFPGDSGQTVRITVAPEKVVGAAKK